MIIDTAEQLANMGIDAEVIDLRSLRPLDETTIYNSVRKTNRCVVVDDAWPYASVGSHVAYLISKNCFDYLDAPVELVTSEDVPMPYNHQLELAAQPSVKKVIDAVKRVTYTM
jgi:pyruvate dehydrogenase E1 component beta subunit